jgi:transketolase
VTEEATPFKPGTATIIRYMGKEEDKFTDAFSIVLSSDYKGGNEDITLIATGPVVAESMRASWILKEEFDIEARVINISTIKPLDKDAVITAALDTGIILTIEEHQKGGLGNLVSSAIFTSSKTYGKLILFDMMGIEDRFGTSGKPWELMKYFKLTAEFITAKSVELLKFKKNVSRKVGDGVAL